MARNRGLRHRGKPPARASVVLAVLALLLQSAALLLHHTLAPHRHGLDVAASVRPSAHHHHDHAQHDHRGAADAPPPAEEKTPDLPPCPVWAGLQHIGGALAVDAPPLAAPEWAAEIIVPLGAGAAPFERMVGVGQPRAPPV